MIMHVMSPLQCLSVQRLCASDFELWAANRNSSSEICELVWLIGMFDVDCDKLYDTGNDVTEIVEALASSRVFEARWTSKAPSKINAPARSHSSL
jgi:hypothetical protein